MGMNGTEVLLYAEDAPGSGNLIVIGSQRDVTFDENNAVIDMSSKDAREQAVDYGRYSSTVRLDALYVPTDTAMLALKQAVRQGLKIIARRVMSGSGVEQATVVVNGNSEAFPDQGASTVSVSMTVDGAWAAV